MDELTCLIVGFVGGGLSALMVVRGIKLSLESKIADMKVQLFALRVELNKWNDDSSNV